MSHYGCHDCRSLGHCLCEEDAKEVDFLDKLIRERTAANPRFPYLLEQAMKRRARGNVENR